MLRYRVGLAFSNLGGGRAPTVLLTSLPSHFGAVGFARSPIGTSDSVGDAGALRVLLCLLMVLKLDCLVNLGGMGSEPSMRTHSSTCSSLDCRIMISRHSPPVARSSPLTITNISSGLSPFLADTELARIGGNSSHRPVVATSQKSTSPPPGKVGALSLRMSSILQSSCWPLEWNSCMSKKSRGTHASCGIDVHSTEKG